MRDGKEEDCERDEDKEEGRKRIRGEEGRSLEFDWLVGERG